MKYLKILKITVVTALLLISVKSLMSQTIEVGNITAELGDTVMVPVNFSGMLNIGSFTIFTVYDPSSIEYLGLANVIPEAAGILGNGGYQTICDTTAIGIIWAASTQGINFPDGKILDMKLVFNNTNASLNSCFIEVTDWDLNILAVNFINGGISVNQGANQSVWTGTGNWTDEANWSNGIPGSITTAIINDGLVNIYSSAISNKLNIYNGAELIIHPTYSLTVFDSLVINGSFTIKSDETGTGSFINMGEIEATGNVLVEQYIVDNDHFISSPVQTAAASVFSGLAVARYDEPTQTWVNLSQSDPLETAKGYKLSNDVNSVYSFSGPFNYGDYSINELDYSVSGQTSFPDGMNLIGNPYPSAISWNAGSWVKSDVHASAYTWNGTQYISWNGEIGALNAGVIPSAQGFIVIANSSNAALDIPNDARIHNQQAYYAKENGKDVFNMVEFSVGGNGYEDKSYLQFKFGSGLGFDAQFDAYKIMGIAEAPQLYTFTNDGVKTSINTLPEVNTSIDTAVKIGFVSPTGGEYQITFEVNTFFGAWDLYLKDAESDSIQSLTADSVYVFNSEPGVYEDRFSLYFKKPSSVDVSKYWDINVYAYQDNLFVNLNEMNEKITLQIFDLEGRLRRTAVMQNTTYFSMPIEELNAGVYIVRIVGESNIFSSKLFIK
jgi:hypothetical protein